VLVLGVAAVAGTLFLPWIRSGEVERNSFAAVRSAQRLEVGAPWTGWVAPMWFVLPALAGLVLLAVALGHDRLAAAVAVVVGATAAALAIVVLVSGGDRLLAPVLTFGAGVVTVMAASWNLVRPIRREAVA
jgi:hypothetical protein